MPDPWIKTKGAIRFYNKTGRCPKYEQMATRRAADEGGHVLRKLDPPFLVPRVLVRHGGAISKIEG
jgi:hypothetical protein